MPFSRTSTCHQGRQVDLLVQPDTLVMTRRAAANSTSIDVEVHMLQVQTLGHAALGKQK